MDSYKSECTAVGIAEDKLKLLGILFFSTKSEGTGLGLTQVFTTIHEHGGNISVKITIGRYDLSYSIAR